MLWILLAAVFGQDPEVEKLKKELEQLKKQTALQQEETQDRQELLERRLKELEQKFEAVSRSTAPLAFNPAVTVFGNFAARADNRTVRTPDGDPVSDRAFLRSLELDLRAAVDPYADGVAIIAIEGGPEEFEVDAEEVYAVVKRIPILEDTVLGSRLRLGKYRPPFGQSNRLHLHDLPQSTRPLIVSKYLGTEHGEFFESGWAPVGAALELSPFPAEALIALDLDLEVVRAGQMALTEDNDGRQPAYFARAQAFKKLSDQVGLTVGASHYVEFGSARVDASGLDVLLQWRKNEWRSFVLGGELIYAGREFLRDTDGDGVVDAKFAATPFGYSVFAQYQLSWHVYAGARLDWVEEPDDDTRETRVWGLHVTYYTSEFLRFRIGLERRDSDLEDEDDTNTFLFEVNFVYGSHPIEPYWVNR